MKKLIALCLALSMVLLVGVGAVQAQSEAPARLNVGLSRTPLALNVWTHNDMTASIIMDLVIPHPVQVTPDGKKYPYIAESVTSNDTATEFTVTLKEGLTWSDGVPMTAEDLKFTVEYCLAHSLSYVPSMYGAVESMDVVDDRTIVYHLSAPNVNFFNSAGYWVSIMPKREFEGVSDPMEHTYSGIGYGPYYVAEYVMGEYVFLKKNPYFTLADSGYVDEIVFRIYNDENAMVLALKNGEVDCSAIMMSVAAQNQFTGSPDFSMLSSQSLGYSFLTASQKVPLLTDVTVRKALAMTVDRDALCVVGYQGGAVPMQTPISPVWKDFVQSNQQQPAFDPDGAAALLEAAGYVDANGDGIREKDGQPLSFALTYSNADSNNVDAVVEILRANALLAGIEIRLAPVDTTAFTANVTAGHTYELSYQMWGTIDDVDTLLHVVYGIGQPLNYMEYNNEEMDALLLAAMSNPVYEERIKIIDEWQKLFVENLPSINLFVATNTYVVNSAKFEGWSIVPGNYGPLSVGVFTGVRAK
ncbi:MAG: ABC transporter substrate-binding protein [Oscillospiraceae bacterium]|jgi:peptide/nickel transport system substrate-binding protein|nr:ABC transporter substrate-binding protein [Oscillospiraceae bacterium]